MKRLRASVLPGVTVAAVLHGGLLALLFLSDPPESRAAVRKPPVRVRVIQRRPPRPEVKSEPVTPKPEDKKPRPEVKKKRKQKPIVRPVLVESLPVTPAPEIEAPRDQPQPEAQAAKSGETRKPRRFSVAMSATVTSGGVAVPTSGSGAGWAFGSREGDPEGERFLASAALGGAGEGVLPLDATAVTALPRLVAQPSFREMRELYPDVARTDGLEADVSLKILVSTRGEVVRIRVLRRAGNGFDEAAEKLVKRFRFKPGRRGEESVAVWIPWTYRFRLEG